MNIKDRIKKLESEIVITASEFCDCFEIYQRQLINSIYDKTPFDESAVILPEGNYCDKCKKPVSPATLKANKDLETIYGDFKDEYTKPN